MPEIKKPRIIVVGAGFAGFHCARWLDRRVGLTAELVLVNPVDHMVYSALLADVLGGVLDPGCLATPLAASLPSTKVLVGTVVAVDATAQSCTVRGIDGREERLAWDRLVLNPGSVTRTLGIGGVLEYAHGFKTLAEATYLREQILRQLQLASAATDDHGRAGHGSFVVVGGGFTGLELAAEGLRLSRAALRQHPTLGLESVRWTVVEAGSTVLGQFPARLARRALDRMRRGGVDVRLGTGVAEIAPDHVQLANGETLPARTVIWTAGVTPAPIVSELGLPVERGRLVVGDNLQAREHPYVYALGDAAAVPDLTHPGKLAAQTAQQAQRQAAARNVSASLGHGRARAYKHHDLGFAVDLGGRNAVATPLGIPLSGLPAKLAGRGYHLQALPSGRLRVLSGWIDSLITRREIAELGLVNERDATIQAEATGGEAIAAGPPSKDDALRGQETRAPGPQGVNRSRASNARANS
jgi:NADH:ubiquinone reductase (H+-translocating)